MGRRAEMGRLRSSIVRTVSRTPSVLEPDFAYAEPPRRRDTEPCRVDFIQRPSENARQVKCCNCEELGHRYSRSDKEKKRFCLGCDQPDLIKSKCFKCQPKNGPAREPAND